MATLRRILGEAEEFVLGLLYLLDGKPVQPDPHFLDRYETHAARRQGHWPSSVEISAAILDNYRDVRKEIGGGYSVRSALPAVAPFGASW